MATFKELGRLGRLGNCMFQASSAIAHSLKMNEPYYFPHIKYNPFFNLTGCFVKNPPFSETYNEPCFAYREIPAKKNLNLYGYFQSHLYFQDFEQEIRKLFYQPLYETKPTLNNCAIHVRRGDYLIHAHRGCYTILGMDYYEKAMVKISADKYYIFSDDINWCKQHFKGDEFIFSNNNNEVDDLREMMGCSNFIIANSSYSWWGAWLSEAKDKRVIAPASWFGPKLAPTHPTNDLIPPDWERV